MGVGGFGWVRVCACASCACAPTLLASIDEAGTNTASACNVQARMIMRTLIRAQFMRFRGAPLAVSSACLGVGGEVEANAQ